MEQNYKNNFDATFFDASSYVGIGVVFEITLEILLLCREGNFPTYHKLTHHVIKSTKYGQLQSAMYCY